MSITFYDLLTDPKYREMTIKQLSDIVSEMDFTNEEYEKGSEFFNKINPESTKPLSANLYYYFEKLKAESEKKAEDIKVIDRYPMCKDQPAQIDCRRIDCIYQNKGQCSNISPAITLNDKSTFVCWSYKDAKGEDKAEPEYQTIYDNPATPYARMVNGKIVCITKEELEKMESGVDKPFFAHGLTETSIETKQAPIQITDQKAREICAKYFNCPPNEIKIV